MTTATRLGNHTIGTAATWPDFAAAPWTRGEGTAVVIPDAPGSAWTYDALTALALDRAAQLRNQGLTPGQLVAAPDRPGPDLILMQHALARAGAALLPLRDTTLAAPTAPPLLAATGAEWAWRPAPHGGGRLVPLDPAASPPGATGTPVTASWSSPLGLVVGTSGSTGSPRAAMLTQANLLAAASLSNHHLGLATGDTWLCCLPLNHIGGLSITYRCALAGATLLLHPDFAADRVAADLERWGVTHCSLVPPMLARLLALGHPPPPRLRVVLVGGQSLSQPLARQAIAAGWPLYLTYGMTETTSQLATSGRLTTTPLPGTVGPPLPGLELDCPDCGDGPGRLRVRGPIVMAGYANPRRTPGQGLVDGWFLTSDLGCRLPDGQVRVLGRADEVLVTGGVNVHPGPVEVTLAGAPGVTEVAVLGAADPVWGQRLVAVYRGSATPDALDRWCRERLEGPARPRSFLRLPALPLLHSGKLDRVALRRLVREPTSGPGRDGPDQSSPPAEPGI